VRAGEEQRRRQAVGERGVAGDGPGGGDLGGRRAGSGVEDVVESLAPGAPVDGGRAERAVLEVGHADHQALVERVFKPDPDAVLAAGVDDELCHPGLFEDAETMSTR
jgi:hypothetical protein